MICLNVGEKQRDSSGESHVSDRARRGKELLLKRPRPRGPGLQFRRTHVGRVGEAADRVTEARCM